MRVVKCDVCGKNFIVEGSGRRSICSDKCRLERRKLYNSNSSYNLGLCYIPPVASIDLMKPDFKSIDEVRRLSKEEGTSYGFYVGLRHARGERV